MKLTPEKAATLVEVLKAQVGPRMEDKDAYKAKLAEVADLLESKDGKFTGGVKSEVFKDNKDNAELVAAAKAHLDKAKERAEKAKAPKAPKAPKAKKETPRRATPDEDKARAEAIVVLLSSITAGKIAPRPAYMKAKNYVDFATGGLKNEAPKDPGLKSPWERFKGFPGVKDAAVAHKAHVAAKAKAKAAPEPSI